MLSCCIRFGSRDRRCMQDRAVVATDLQTWLSRRPERSNEVVAGDLTSGLGIAGELEPQAVCIAENDDVPATLV